MDRSLWTSVKAVLPQLYMECKDDMGRSMCLTITRLSCETEFVMLWSDKGPGNHKAGHLMLTTN